MQKAFRESGLESVEINMFIEYARNAIEMREASKFVFTKILSRILEVVAEYAQSIKITRHEISFFTIQEIISFYRGTILTKLTELREEMKRRQKLRKIENA